jgi:hypothetical protein
MVVKDCLYIPDKVWNDITSVESKECILTALMESHHERLELGKAKDYIKELEQKVDDLQKALDVVLLNKCRTRKVKVKYIGRCKMD